MCETNIIVGPDWFVHTYSNSLFCSIDNFIFIIEYILRNHASTNAIDIIVKMASTGFCEWERQ